MYNPNLEDHGSDLDICYDGTPLIRYKKFVRKGSRNPILTGQKRSPWLLKEYCSNFKGPWNCWLETTSCNLQQNVAPVSSWLSKTCIRLSRRLARRRIWRLKIARNDSVIATSFKGRTCALWMKWPVVVVASNQPTAHVARVVGAPPTVRPAAVFAAKAAASAAADWSPSRTPTSPPRRV